MKRQKKNKQILKNLKKVKSKIFESLKIDKLRARFYLFFTINGILNLIISIKINIF